MLITAWKYLNTVQVLLSLQHGWLLSKEDLQLLWPFSAILSLLWFFSPVAILLDNFFPFLATAWPYLAFIQLCPSGYFQQHPHQQLWYGTPPALFHSVSLSLSCSSAAASLSNWLYKSCTDIFLTKSTNCSSFILLWNVATGLKKLIFTNWNVLFNNSKLLWQNYRL